MGVQRLHVRIGVGRELHVHLGTGSQQGREVGEPGARDRTGRLGDGARAGVHEVGRLHDVQLVEQIRVDEQRDREVARLLQPHDRVQGSVQPPTR